MKMGPDANCSLAHPVFRWNGLLLRHPAVNATGWQRFSAAWITIATQQNPSMECIRRKML
jgi:hypothetical protein